MIKKKKPTPKRKGMFTVFGLEVNGNSVITTVIGAGTWLMISWALSWAKANNDSLKQIPQIVQDLSSVKKEQTRLRKEYVPPVPKPTPNQEEHAN
jgi:hypothetical protein